MCGIFGIVSDRGVDPGILWSGTHLARHRGPDDWGFVSLAPVRSSVPDQRAWRFLNEAARVENCRVGLGSRRLSILDLSHAGHQPMNLPGTTLWIVFNGEIYNYLELRSELANEHRFATGTDTETLLAAYQKWGTGCLARLNGMFAFAVWDGARQRLLLARDRFGEKPLYYFHQNGRFAFASELKQFFSDPEFPCDIDESALADFLLLSLQNHDERTFLQRVRQLRPAHSLEFDLSTGELHGPYRYWMPEIADDLDSSRDKQFLQEMPGLLHDSIRLRLRSDVRVGVCLSGGLDSTTICSLAANQVSDAASLSAYTMAFPGHPEDESAYAKSAAAHTGVRYVESSITAATIWNQLREFIHFQDGPTGGASTFASWQVFKAARADGTTVLLSGQGGDELFAGYNKFFLFWLETLLARGCLVRFGAAAASYLYRNGLAKWSYADGKRYLPFLSRNLTMSLWQFSFPDLRQHATEGVNFGRSESLNVRLWKDLSEFSLPCLLHWEDRNSMAAGTEARLPFLDHRLVEAVLATSAYTKLKSGFTKSSLRHVMSGQLPAAICWQKSKSGFDTPAKHWFQRDLAECTEDVLSQRQSHLSEFLDMARLREHFKLFRDGDGGSALTSYDWFKIIGTAIWLDQVKERITNSPSVLAIR
ncbi:MAG: asparagine synthase (glutamine-hydrolyzing) [Candidatus Acidiferrales bacterium]